LAVAPAEPRRGANREAVNPNVEGAPNAGGLNAEHSVATDGQRCDVTRSVTLGGLDASLCVDSAAARHAEGWSSLVTVTAWREAASAQASGHTAPKLLPPHLPPRAGLTPGFAAVTVEVKGMGGDKADAPRDGILVELRGGGRFARTAYTNEEGWAFFLVQPSATGGDYQARLLGGHGPGTYVAPGGAAKPTQAVSTLAPGADRLVTFEAYDLAARLRVDVANWDGIARPITLWASAGGAAVGAAQQYNGAAVLFDRLYPGAYSVELSGVPPVAVTLAANETGEATLVLA
jgi:hypothetical protein